jgi:hypothetical protein
MDSAPALPFTDLPAPPEPEWRQHTGSTVGRHYPEAKADALQLIREGVSISEVARLIGPRIGRDGEGSLDGLRKIIRAWIIEARIDMSDIARVKASILRDEALERATDIMPHATKRELGSIAMMLTQAHQVERNLGGLPTEIKLTTKLTLADLEALRQPPPPRDITPIIDLDPTPPQPHAKT